ncbi:MAG: NADH-quinone oxidoreductase subunit A [Dehalococcoidia bacterium]|jgi:NADH-quinone oxidoreductase subunit A|tara:strand:- start:2258 stop:2659 length:402 start_codon:yes stop_codon:yes gene_type:complete
MEEYSIYFERYGYFSLFLVVALLVPSGMLITSTALKFLGIRKSNPSEVKTDIYEAGIKTFSAKWTGFNFRYYTFAMMFLIFDVEVIFLFPWAASLIKLNKEFSEAVLVEMFIFIGVLILGWFLAWKQKAIEWE